MNEADDDRELEAFPEVKACVEAERALPGLSARERDALFSSISSTLGFDPPSGGGQGGLAAGPGSEEGKAGQPIGMQRVSLRMAGLMASGALVAGLAAGLVIASTWGPAPQRVSAPEPLRFTAIPVPMPCVVHRAHEAGPLAPSSAPVARSGALPVGPEPPRCAPVPRTLAAPDPPEPPDPCVAVVQQVRQLLVREHRPLEALLAARAGGPRCLAGQHGSKLEAYEAMALAGAGRCLEALAACTQFSARRPEDPLRSDVESACAECRIAAKEPSP